ncbi:hypothetical protein SERLADRAFT_445838 [Serpula lacrymans var. lacrymans S7.9]|uniref:Uncharacterized protein n=1 Tax=Serpula lacrymans var. lacrymans (strain S7.9) TaxID=578457 RepID=F8NK21_SERL9|nr:uncharacterized protein SERLADRAFT_445838 [Serpula lacrymans var. lacrymans S7.9]EGO28333.1 hypothetical protein SERLADRAFT_445838 [Serpula lacrymans var. lacrymans S7.9]
MLVVDAMHEIELGVWKAIFTHIVRILYASVEGSQAVAKLDARFREIPAFGQSTIRRFSNNASEMKKLATRDLEDLLQCAIPGIEGLLPSPHNQNITRLIFRLAQWHALAKLRMHRESTLAMLNDATVTLGKELRNFCNVTCTAFATKELPRETSSRMQRAKHNALGEIIQTKEYKYHAGRNSTFQPTRSMHWVIM